MTRAIKKGRAVDSEGYSEDEYGDEDDYQSYDEDEDYESDEDVATGEKSNVTSLTKDQLLLCSASLKGYTLKNKKWLTFSIGSVLDIEYSESAFESLVLPEDHKELILALVESQVAHRDSFDDVIQGKVRTFRSYFYYLRDQILSRQTFWAN